MAESRAGAESEPEGPMNDGRYSAWTMEGEHTITPQWFACDLAMHAMRSIRGWDRPIFVNINGSVSVGNEPDWHGAPVVVELPIEITTRTINSARRWATAVLFSQLGFD